MRGKKTTGNNNFYLSILNILKTSTNLTKIQEKLDISKQNLNYYLRELKKNGYIYNKDRGWYELTERSKNLTKYDKILSKDISRGHAYIWNIYFSKEIKNWNKRIQILQQKDVHFILVGALKTTPRIKVLGRKIWLCNDHLRIFDKKKMSYYGLDAKESRYLAFQEIKSIVGTLNRKLGILLHPSKIHFQKEHYALIKNDLAIDQNKKGNIWRINDEDGEWLLIDDSLGEGGELENVGKKAFQTNIPMQKWWNDNKETGFKVTPNFILETFSKIAETQILDKANIQLHQKVLSDMSKTLKQIRDDLSKGKKT